MRPAEPQPAAICTIVARNYLAQARCLAESFAAQHPGGRMFVLVVDQPEDDDDLAGALFELVRLADLPIADVAQMAFRYTVLELSTAVKPFLLEHLLGRYGLDHLIYLDPDIYCYRPLTPLLDALQTHMVALTPHLLEPLDDEFRPSELDILRVGVYNLGCIGVARRPETTSFLRWWQRRLERDCVVDLGRGLFVDQGWIDLAPTLFGGVAIVRDPGCNVAYWNLSQRPVARGADGWTANGAPLTFYHFSGLDLDNLDQISKHQNRITIADAPALRPLLEHYRERMLAHGYEAVRRWPYGFGRFDNGVAIPDVARQLWRAGSGEDRWTAPFAAGASSSFFAWLNQEADQPSDDGMVLSNLALEIYRQRVDLQQAFPDVLGAHRRAFLEWFAKDAMAQHTLDEAFVAAVLPPDGTADAAQALATPPAPTQAAWMRANRFARALGEPLPEEPLIGEPSLSRRLYYSVRNPLRRLGLHRPLKRLLGLRLATHILDTMVMEPAAAAPVIRRAPPRAALYQAPARPPSGLNLVGYLEQSTGVGEVARSLLRAVEGGGYPVVGIETPSVELARPGAPAGPYSCNLLCVNADMTATVQRALGRAFFEQRYTIGFWHWETADFPPEWHDRAAMLNELWVASEFVSRTLQPFVGVPLQRIRIPIAITPPAVVRRADLGLPDDRFIWLYAFDMRSYAARKNPQGVVEAYRRAFGTCSDTTQLVLKVQHPEADPMAAARLRDDIEAVGGRLISRSMDRMELSALFAACDGYVSLHRCEGFGLTIAEAMALGKPAVATGYSGNMDFMHPENSYPVRFQLAELDRTHGPYRRGTHWAEPDLDHAAELLRQVCERPDEARQRAAVAAADIARWYGGQPAGRAIIERLVTIERGL